MVLTDIIESADPPYMLSSATLYDLKVKAQRETFFESWLQSNPAPNQMDIVGFHHTFYKEFLPLTIAKQMEAVANAF